MYPQENPGYLSKKLKCLLRCIPYKNIRIVEKENIILKEISMSSLYAGPSSQRWSSDILVYIKIKSEDSDCTHPFVQGKDPHVTITVNTKCNG